MKLVAGRRTFVMSRVVGDARPQNEDPAQGWKIARVIEAGEAIEYPDDLLAMALADSRPQDWAIAEETGGVERLGR